MVKIQVIIPVQNEEKNLPLCLAALNKQTVKPSKVIIVDDGSADHSLDVIRNYADASYCIVKLPQKPQKSAKVMDSQETSVHYCHVASEGSKKLDSDFDYVAILDADTVLEQDYYEKLIGKFEGQPSLGFAGGALLNTTEVGETLGLLPFVLGCNRVYSRDCWLRLNDGSSVLKVKGRYDTVHDMEARSMGYSPVRFDDVKSYALRDPAKSTFWDGYYSWLLGYHHWYFLMRAVRRRSPKMVAGYVKAWICNVEQYEIKPLIRQFQLERIKRLL